jgi:predicted 3-demethylubiquinone-9 3-methyltransferase (glyoxalase superfamily)
MYIGLFIDSQGCRHMSAYVDVCPEWVVENGKLRVENDAKWSKSVQYFKMMNGSIICIIFVWKNKSDMTINVNSQIHTCLWFDNCAKEAAEFYCKVFKNGKILSENPVAVEFEINNTKFMGINGGDMYKPSEAVSLVVYCATQEEIDCYWDSLTAEGGEESVCGWLKDKYGFSWQIIPFNISELMTKPEVAGELLKMKKIDIEILKKYCQQE